MDMYKCIGWELDLAPEHYRASAYRVLQAEITRPACEARRQPVLIVDEAHHLRNDVLEDLRLLTTFAMDSASRLCLVLIGLTELRRRLSMAAHESLAQRLIVKHHLRGLGREELDACLTHPTADADRVPSQRNTHVAVGGREPAGPGTAAARYEDRPAGGAAGAGRRQRPGRYTLVGARRVGHSGSQARHSHAQADSVTMHAAIVDAENEAAQAFHERFGFAPFPSRFGARRRTRVVGTDPEGHSASMPVAAPLRHVSTTHWGLRRYMNMKLIKEMDNERACSAA